MLNVSCTHVKINIVYVILIQTRSTIITMNETMTYKCRLKKKIDLCESTIDNMGNIF